MEAFAALADDIRLGIVDELSKGERAVGQLVERFDVTQPSISQHLKVLRDAGVVEAEVAGRRRVYRLARDPIPDVLAWVLPYAELWSERLDRLAEAMDDMKREQS